MQKTVVYVTFFNIDDLVLRFGRKELVDVLIPLLTDTSKDWCANLLLYEITEHDATNFFVIQSKKEWTETIMQRDLAYWKKFRY